MNSIKIAGVPEHFNAPWKYAIAENLFTEAGLNLEFIEYGTGTGAMCHDLSDGTLDMAILLTEGIASYQQQDPSLTIISTYVDTPLVWGIHVKDTTLKSTTELKNKTFAISRFGSGSHLMVKLLAKKYHWDFAKIKFLEVGNIDNLGSALLNGDADVFLWEIFTTKPYLDRYQLHLLDTLPTPWPCFQIVATSAMAAQKALMNTLCEVIFSVCSRFNSDHAFALSQIQRFYGLEAHDIESWLKTVRWAEKRYLINFDNYSKYLSDAEDNI